jgi:thiamine pyrophosphokinase
MRAFIYIGGEIFPEFITEHPAGEDIVIAADAGYKNALLLGEKPSVLVGDFDSLGEDDIPSGVELIRLKPEKDVTDTQVAAHAAIERGAESITFIGGLSGRLDHTLANLSLLEELCAKNVYAVMNDGANRVRFIRNSSSIIGRSHYKYISVIAADEKVRGVDIEGCKYNLKNAVITRRDQYGVSNEIDGNCAFIAVKKGGIFIIESRDKISR